MLFKLTREKPRQVLASDDKAHWCAVTPAYLESQIGGRWNWVGKVQTPGLKRTQLVMGLDEGLDLQTGPRPVALRTVVYRLEDLVSDEAVRRRRRILSAQLELLNHLQSPLLPEPLDWLEIENPLDPFGKAVSSRVRRTEPVLVLDWQRGTSVQAMLQQRAAAGDAKPWGIRRIARIARRLLRWISYLHNNGVAWFNLHPSHILLLQNDVPRFVGLGGFCPVLPGGELDARHPGFLRTIKGYCPPEFSDDDAVLSKARRSSTLEIGAFALGVLILQLTTLEPTIPPAWLSKGSFDAYGGEWRQAIKEHRHREIIVLVEELCDPDPGARLIDPERIRQRLDALAGEAERFHGTIQTWKPSGKTPYWFGFLRPDNSIEQLYFHEMALPEDLRTMQYLKGLRVSFELEDQSDGGFRIVRMRQAV